MICRTGLGASVALLAALLAGCAGNGQGLDSSGRPLSESSGPQPLSADFNSLQVNVFTPICTACHAGASAPQGLRLDAANSYNLLVGVPSSQVSSLLRVRIGDPNNSYLIQKLEGRAAVGGQMPLGGPPLPSATIAFIRQWISNGAPRPAASAPGGIESFLVATTAPEDGAVLASAPAQLVVAMTRELSASWVDAASVKLERLSVADDINATTRVGADVALAADNNHTLIITPRETLPAGSYRVIVSSSDGNTIQSVDGKLLSGLSIDAKGDQIVADFAVEAVP